MKYKTTLTLTEEQIYDIGGRVFEKDIKDCEMDLSIKAGKLMIDVYHPDYHPPRQVRFDLLERVTRLISLQWTEDYKDVVIALRCFEKITEMLRKEESEWPRQ